MSKTINEILAEYNSIKITNPYHINNSPVCEHCNKRPALKTGGDSKYECSNYANTGSCEGYKPFINKNKQQNNDLCNCNSGLKFKKCCKNKNKENDK